MGRLVLTLPDASAAEALGARLADLLRTGDAILLSGALGAGKTTLARGLIAAFAGVRDAPSPTYTLVQTYQRDDGGLLAHADLYRVEDASELEELGLEEALEAGALLIEWPDRLGDRRPDDRLEIVLADAPGGGRKAEISSFGSWEDRLDDVA